MGGYCLSEDKIKELYYPYTFSINWTDWLPDGEYKIIFRNRDGSLSKVHVATKLSE